MIHLFQPPPPGWDRIGNMSPFCLKLEMWLRMTNTPYKSRKADFRKAPKGKIPWIEDDSRGVTMGDSGLIIDYLKSAYSVKIDDRLTPEQLALSVAIQRVIEEHMYFGAIVMRWGDDSSFGYVRAFFMKIMPPLIGGMIMKKIRKNVLSQAYRQGMGRHSRQDLESLLRADLDALVVFLGDKKFIHGDSPTTIDAILYGFMANLMWTPWDSAFKSYALTKLTLVSHLERMHEIFVKGSPAKS